MCLQGNNSELNLLDLLFDDAPCLHNITSYSWDKNDTTSLAQLLTEFKKSLYLFHEPCTVVLLCLYALVFILSVVGNSLVLTVILSQKGQRSSTSLFLLVMALSDLLGMYFVMYALLNSYKKTTAIWWAKYTFIIITGKYIYIYIYIHTQIYDK